MKELENRCPDVSGRLQETDLGESMGGIIGGIPFSREIAKAHFEHITRPDKNSPDGNLSDCKWANWDQPNAYRRGFQLPCSKREMLPHQGYGIRPELHLRKAEGKAGHCCQRAESLKIGFACVCETQDRDSRLPSYGCSVEYYQRLEKRHHELYRH
jgi:hypothetical protein